MFHDHKNLKLTLIFFLPSKRITTKTKTNRDRQESTQEPRKRQEKDESTTKDEMQDIPNLSCVVKTVMDSLKKNPWVWVFISFLCILSISYLVGSAGGTSQREYSNYGGYHEESRYREGGEGMQSFEGDQDSFGDRLLVHTGRLSLRSHTDNMETLENKIMNLTTTPGEGYVEAKYSKIFPNWVRTELDLHVAGNKFHTVVESIRNLAVVQEISIRSKDVTDQYFDSSSESETVRKSIEAFSLLLSEATTVKDTMTVQKELIQLEQEYDALSCLRTLLQPVTSSICSHFFIANHRIVCFLFSYCKDLSRLKVTLLMEKAGPRNGSRNPIEHALGDLRLVLDGVCNFIMYASVWLVPIATIMLLTKLWMKMCGDSTS